LHGIVILRKQRQVSKFWSNLKSV